MNGRAQVRLQQALGQAMALAQSGQANAAEELLRNILIGAPGNADALQLLGMIARSRKENAKAADFFRQSLRANPRQPQLLNTLGNALRDLGRHQEAIAAYEQAVELQDGFSDALTNLGLAQLSAGNTERARNALERAVAANRTNAKAWSALGRALRAADKLAEAIQAFYTSLSLRPDHVPTLHNLAVALRLSGKPGKAAAILERCAAADPLSAAIPYVLGHCYYDLDRLDEAEASYRAAVAINPNDREAHDSLNRLYWQRGKTGQYLSSYVTALRENPGNADLLADLASRLNLDGRTAESAALLQDAVSRGLATAAVHHRLGQALWEQGRFDAALADFRAAIDADPNACEAPLELARSLIILERYEEALDALQPVLRRRPFDQQAIAYQALAWRFLGDERADTLNDYERFVAARVLQPPQGHGSVEEFNHRLEAALARLHTTSQHPLEQTLRGGTQTMGNLFHKHVPEIAVLRGMIEEEVRRYIEALPKERGHAFLGRKSASFRFSGSWSVRLRSQGFHLNHVHSAGWISSCYYVGLPGAVEREGAQEGWIKFGETGLHLGKRERVTKLVKPEPGKLVLFPSYFYHGTVPFDEDSYRTTVAFDVLPD